MESLEGEEFDLNWVCCLLDGIPSTCCDSSAMQFNVPVGTPHLDSFLSSTSHSAGIQDTCEDYSSPEECCRKRIRVESVTACNSKACREKQRRDNLNKRFLELSSVLDLGTTPKLDKAAILTDAVRMLKLLREEASSLTSQNGEIKQKINEVKAEKNALRAEKRMLVSEKEKMEQRIRALGAHPSMQFHATSIPTSYGIPCQAVGGKLMPMVSYPSVPLWQFVPQAAIDTSQDHYLRPPVA